MPAYQIVTAAGAVVSAAGVIATGGILIFRQGRFFGKLQEHDQQQDIKIKANCDSLKNLSASFFNFRTDFDRARYMTEKQHDAWCGRMKTDTDKDIDEIKILLATGEKRRDDSRKEDAEYKGKIFDLLSSIKSAVDVIAANHNNLAERVDRLEAKR